MLFVVWQDIDLESPPQKSPVRTFDRKALTGPSNPAREMKETILQRL